MYSDYICHRQQRKRFLLILLSTLMILSCVTNFLYANEEITTSHIQRSIVKQLRYIDANKAKEYLVTLGIGTDINKLGSMNALIITTDNNRDRMKASALIALVDSPTKFDLIRLKVGSIPEKIDDISSIQSKIEGIMLGTFRNPPARTELPNGIIDVQDSVLIALVPKGYAPPIVSILEDMYRIKSDTATFPEDIDIQETLIDSHTANHSDTGTVKRGEKEPTETDRLIITTTDDKVTHKEPEFDATVTELANIVDAMTAINDASTEDESPVKTDFNNEELLEALTTVEQETAAIIVTEKIIEKVATEPAMIAEQVVVTEAPEKTKTEAVEPKIKPASVISAKSFDKGKQPSMAELMAKIAEMTKDNTGGDIIAKRTGKTVKPEKPIAPVKAEPVKAEPVKKIIAERKPNSKLDNHLSETELEMTISIPSKVLVIDLLKLVGEQLGLNYMYDTKEIVGGVTLFINDGKIKVGQLYALLENVLQFRGLVMTRRGKFVTIVRKDKLAYIDPKIVMPGEKLETGNVVVTQVFKLEHIDTKTAIVMLNSMKLGISMQDIPQMQTLIITGYASRMERIKEVLQMVDKAGKDRIFRFRNLKYTMATSLVSKIKTLAKELGTVSITIGSKTKAPAVKRMTAAERAKRGRSKPPTGRSSGTSSTTVGGAFDSGNVYLDIDDRTNRILMIGLTEGIDIIGSLIDSLDIPQSGLKEMRQYKIVNVEAAYVIDVLGELGATTPGARPPAQRKQISSKTPQRKPKQPTTPLRGATSSAGPQVSLLEGTNSLLINASPEEHDRITAIIIYVDVPKEDSRTIREYEIESVDTSEILDTMRELGLISTMPGSSSSMGRTTARTTSNRGKTTPPLRSSTTSSPQGSSSADPISGEPMIAVLESANSLLINATADQHMQIAMIIAHVDRELTDSSNPYVIYPLENQDPIELKPILDELVNATIQATTQGKSSVPGTPPTAKIVSQPKNSGMRDEDEITTIVSDPATYSLIVYASKKNQLWIGNLIAELDAYRPQVLLDVTLVEISKNDIFTYDLEMVSSLPNLANTSGILSSIAGTTTDVIGTALAGAPDRNKFIDLAFDSTSGGRGFYADTHVNALLTLMQTKGYGRVLASPKLLVNDNETGSITTSDTTYVTRTNSSNSTGSSNTVVTESTRDDPYTAGITLSIEPHISTGDNLRLIIDLERSDFGLISGTKPPDTANNNISTTVTVPNNATIILGGMERLNQSKGGTKIPILGDIPLVGGLFRSTSNSDIQKKLYIFVKAHILRPGTGKKGRSDIKRISDRKREEFEKMELEMQGYQDWPGIKPKPMDPIHILESDEYLSGINAGQQVGGNVISIPVVTPARVKRGRIIDNDEYLQKIRDAKIKEIEEAAAVGTASDAMHPEILLDDENITEPRPRQLMGSTTRVEVVLPE